MTTKERNSSDAAYRELAKHCKDEISLHDPLDDTDEAQEIEVADVSETYDEQYENLNESYFPSGNETIALKVIDNQLSKFLFFASISVPSIPDDKTNTFKVDFNKNYVL